MHHSDLKSNCTGTCGLLTLSRAGFTVKEFNWAARSMRHRNIWRRFNRFQRAVISCIAAAVLLIAILPRSRLIDAIIGVCSGALLLCGILWASTFWTRARIGLDRFNLRYTVIRRNAAALALISLLLLLSRAGSVVLRNTSRVHSRSASQFSYTMNDAEQAVVQCFCDDLSARRKADARLNYGVPRSLWPNYGDVIACVQNISNVDRQRAELAWSKQRWETLEGTDGEAICQNAGIPIYEEDPPPAGPEIMEAAHQTICRLFAEPVGGNLESLDYSSANREEASAIETERGRRQVAHREAGFANVFHISTEQAHSVLNRAFAEHGAANPVFLCPGEQPPPRDAELRAPPTDDEIAQARRAFCEAAHRHPQPRTASGSTLFEAAQSIYENSVRTTLERYRVPMIIDQVGDALLLGGWSPNSCSR